MKWLGISAFAILNANFPIAKFLEQYPSGVKNPAIAVLLLHFGRKAKNLKAFCDKFKDRKHLVEMHLGFRDFTDSELLKMTAATKRKIDAKIKEAKRVMRVAGNDNTVWIVSPILEDTNSFKAWQVYARIVRKELSLPIVRCTIGTSAKGGRFEEKHGKNPCFSRDKKRCIANPDGVSINYGGKEKYDRQLSESQAMNYKNSMRGRFAVFTWSADQQGLGGTTNYQKPPIDKRKYVVTDAAIKFHNERWFE
jgi:hypothetical protein